MDAQNIYEVETKSNLLDETYQRMIRVTLSQCRKLNDPNLDYSRLYNQTSIPFKEDRTLNIRWIKLPTFKHENIQQYYTIFLNDIDYWRMGEKEQLHAQIVEAYDDYDTDCYTIFQFGKYHGHVDRITHDLIKYYHIYNFNTRHPQPYNIDTIYKFITNLLQKRIDGQQQNCVIFPELKKEIERIQDFIKMLNSSLSLNVISKYNKKTSYNTSYYKKTK